MCDETKTVVVQQPRYETDQLNELAAALAKAQGQMKFAKKDASNPYFKSKYADLADVVEAARAALAENGLAVVQRVITNGNGMRLYTRLLHASGQWMESSMAVNPPKQDIQSIGSYITYLRRYMFSSIAGVVSSEFIEDDDGNKATSDQKANDEQFKALEMIFKKLPNEKQQEFYAKSKISALDEIDPAKYTAAKNYIVGMVAQQTKEATNAGN